MRKFETIALCKANFEQGKVLRKNELKYLMGGYNGAICPDSYVLCNCPIYHSEHWYSADNCFPYFCPNGCTSA